MSIETPIKKQKFLEYYRDLPNQELAAGYAGVHKDTIPEWKKSDPDFAYQVAEAKSNWAMKNAKGIRNKEWLLERCLNDHFGQKTKTDITSNGEKITPIYGGLSKDGNVQGHDSNKKDIQAK